MFPICAGMYSTHLTRLSPAFFDSTQSGEIVSRLTADTTQIKSAVGATASVALRNLILALGAIVMMIDYERQTVGTCDRGHPVDHHSVGRFRAIGAAPFTRRPGYAGQCHGLCERIHRLGAHAAGIHQRETGNNAVWRIGRRCVFWRRDPRSRPGRSLTAFAIFMIFSSVVAVLWFGSRDVLSGAMTPGTLGQFLLYSVFAAGALGALSEVWGELSASIGCCRTTDGNPGRKTGHRQRRPILPALPQPADWFGEL